MKSLTEFLYVAKMKKAIECFDKKLNNIGENNRIFFEENELELRKCYILEFNNYFVRLTVTNQKFSEKLGNELKNSFDECFKELSKKE